MSDDYKKKRLLKFKTKRKLKKALKRARIEAVPQEGDDEHIRLNKIDVDVGFFRPEEADAALFLQEMLSCKLERCSRNQETKKSGDFVFLDGKYQGKLLDVMYSCGDDKQDFLNSSVRENFFYGYKIIHHLYKSDFVALDFRRLTADNCTTIETFLHKTLQQEDLDRVFILRNNPTTTTATTATATTAT